MCTGLGLSAARALFTAGVVCCGSGESEERFGVVDQWWLGIHGGKCPRSVWGQFLRRHGCSQGRGAELPSQGNDWRISGR